MCGIAGVMSERGESITAVAALRAMSTAMWRRGPDDEGYLVVDGDRRVHLLAGDTTVPGIPLRDAPARNIGTASELSGVLFMAHRRLSIIDTSPTGHQPMSVTEGRFWVVYNGEIFNYREIRAALEGRGRRFETESDTEVLLNGYACWGRGVLDRLNGMYAFALWDNETSTLFCARDRLGIKPLYYLQARGQFIFASDLKTLIAGQTGFNVKIDAEGLFYGLTYGVTPRPATCLEGVLSLEPGHWIEIKLGVGLKSGCYWRLPHGVQNKRMSEDVAVEGLTERLNRAVERQLVADTEVGAFMSGGIDSTTVSVVASRFRPGLKAFTLGFEGSATNEVEQARATARKNDIHHIVDFFQPEQALARVREMVKCYEEPFYSLSPNYLIAELVSSHGIKVILNGLGGDELFAGYRKYDVTMNTSIRKLSTPAFRLLQRLWPRLDGNDRGAISDFAAKHFSHSHTVLTDREKRRLFDWNIPEHWHSADRLAELYLPVSPRFNDYIEALGFLDIMHTIGNHHLYRVDQFTMRFSIEGRFPLLDHELVEFACTVPSHLKIRHSQRKYVLRKVAAKYIDESCLSMPKKGFGFPMKKWLAGPLREFAMDKLEDLKHCDFLDVAEVDRYRRSVETGEYATNKVWMLVGLQLWMEEVLSPSEIPIRNSQPIPAIT